MENKINPQVDTFEQENGSYAIPPAEKPGITPETILADVKGLIKEAHEIKAKKKNCFPVDAFPVEVQQIIRETNRCLNFPVDFIGASLLCAAGVAIGNTHKIQAKNTWCESPVMYLALVGRAGTNKSHPLSFAFEPIREHDIKTYREYQKEKEEYEYAANLNKKEKEEFGINEPVKPNWKKHLVSDITPESLAEVHKFNIRGIGLYSDELAGWFKNFNRYNSGSEEQFWLSAWSSKPVIVDRKSGEPILISSPFISVVGTVQNGVLKELSGNNRSQNGFIDRILFAFPGGIESSRWSEAEVSGTIISNWEKIISSLLKLPHQLDEVGNPQSAILLFEPESKERFVQWFNHNADLSNASENEGIAGLYAKLNQYTLRFALILELLRWACGKSDKQTVGVEAVNGAIKLAEYFRITALKVHEIVSNPLKELPDDKQNLYAALPDTFTTAEGIETATSQIPPIPEDTFHKFLRRYSKEPVKLFRKIRKGQYEKIV